MDRQKQITIEQFEALLPLICDRETSQDPDHWTPENYLCGHCAVVSQLAKVTFGGVLLRASLLKYPEFAHMRSHYLNKLPDGTIKDFTAGQFGNNYPQDMELQEKDSEYVLSYPETVKRYKLLADRFARM